MNNIYIMADIGQAHEGSVALAHSYIDALAETGVDAVKFQIHIAEAESSIYENFRVQQPFAGPSRMDYWRSMEFSENEWRGLKNHCSEKHLDFVVSPFSVAAVELGRRLGVDKFKIGSAEVDDLLILEKLSTVCKNLILSSGMSSTRELDETVNFLKSRQCTLTLLQCTTAYPTVPAQWGLNLIAEFRKRYKIPVGLSDHSGDPTACLAAAALAAEMLEFHVIFDRRMSCPDAKASLTPDEITRLVKGVRQIENSLCSPVDKSDNTGFEELRHLFGKSLAVNKTLHPGHLLTIDDLESKKPAGCGIPVRQLSQVLGKSITIQLQQWDFLKTEHLT